MYFNYYFLIIIFYYYILKGFKLNIWEFNHFLSQLSEHNLYQVWQLLGQGGWHWKRSEVIHCLGADLCGCVNLLLEHFLMWTIGTFKKKQWAKNKWQQKHNNIHKLDTDCPPHPTHPPNTHTHTHTHTHACVQTNTHTHTPTHTHRSITLNTLIYTRQAGDSWKCQG